MHKKTGVQSTPIRLLYILQYVDYIRDYRHVGAQVNALKPAPVHTDCLHPRTERALNIVNRMVADVNALLRLDAESVSTAPEYLGIRLFDPLLVRKHSRVEIPV